MVTMTKVLVPGAMSAPTIRSRRRGGRGSRQLGPRHEEGFLTTQTYAVGDLTVDSVTSYYDAHLAERGWADVDQQTVGDGIRRRWANGSVGVEVTAFPATTVEPPRGAEEDDDRVQYSLLFGPLEDVVQAAATSTTAASPTSTASTGTAATSAATPTATS
jgi:hypothetical protein